MTADTLIKAGHAAVKVLARFGVRRAYTVPGETFSAGFSPVYTPYSGGVSYMSNSRTGTIKDRLERLGPYRLGDPNPGAAERAREIKQRQKDRGVNFSDSTEVVRADRDSR